MNAFAVLPLAFGGLSLISLSMRRHARDAGLTSEPRWLRALGWGVISLSLVVALAASNWRFALVEWIGLAALAAALVVMLLHLVPRALPRLAIGGSVIGGFAGLLQLLQ